MVFSIKYDLYCASVTLRKSFSQVRIFPHESSYCFQRVLAIAIQSVCLSVCLSVTRVDQAKRFKLGSSNLHLQLPWRL